MNSAMFETAELGAKVSKQQYRDEAQPLRLELLKHQFELRDADFPVVVLLAGDDRRGREGVLHLLQEWLDPRFMDVHGFLRPTDEEKERPAFWRYWRRLPPNGRIGIFLGAWATGLIRETVWGEADEDRFGHAINHIQRLEQELAEDGAVVVKLWLHLPKGEHEKRLKKNNKKKNGFSHLRDLEREVFENYEPAMQVSERVLSLTSTGRAPWTIVESTDWRARNLAVARALLKAIAKRMALAPAMVEPATIALARGGAEATRTILDKVDLSAVLDKDEYEDRLESEQRRLNELSFAALEKGVSSVLVFEGWDAGGKGGAVRRLTAALDPTACRVVPIAAPTQEERAHHYLWRFWRHIPRRGEVTIFDRSWYGRVLVERVEGFAGRAEYNRAYHEINDFEEQLIDAGILVHKFWIHIDKDEQLRRFKAREQTPFKKYKITEEDYRNRERWSAYERAINDMVMQTSTPRAPWTIVAGNDKRAARVQVVRTYRRRLEEML
ncbi:MAG: polyphosphate:AMP phosphotransferase [Planctomycetota bacterium]